MQRCRLPAWQKKRCLKLSETSEEDFTVNSYNILLTPSESWAVAGIHNPFVWVEKYYDGIFRQTSKCLSRRYIHTVLRQQYNNRKTDKYLLRSPTDICETSNPKPAFCNAFLHNLQSAFDTVPSLTTVCGAYPKIFWETAATICSL